MVEAAFSISPPVLALYIIYVLCCSIIYGFNICHPEISSPPPLHLYLSISSVLSIFSPDVNSDIFPSHVQLYVQNDAVAALASGTMGKLHGCVLIAGTGTIAYGFTEDGREARAAGAGPILGDWGRYIGLCG